ncbi:hypothetical protein D3C86_1258960 [compost metagenome]
MTVVPSACAKALPVASSPRAVAASTSFPCSCRSRTSATRTSRRAGAVRGGGESSSEIAARVRGATGTSTTQRAMAPSTAGARRLAITEQATPSHTQRARYAAEQAAKAKSRRPQPAPSGIPPVTSQATGAARPTESK